MTFKDRQVVLIQGDDGLWNVRCKILIGRDHMETCPNSYTILNILIGSKVTWSEHLILLVWSMIVNEAIPE